MRPHIALLRDGPDDFFPRGTQTVDWIPRRQEFHRAIPIVLELSKLAVNVWIVDFASTGFMTAGDVGDVHEPDDVNVLLQFLDEVALGNLFVKEVVEKSHVRGSDFAHDVEPFRDRRQKIFRIFLWVDILKEQLDILL